VGAGGELFTAGSSIKDIPGMTQQVKTGSIFGFDQFGISPTSAGSSLLKGNRAASIFNTGVQGVTNVGGQVMNTADYYTRIRAI